MRKAAAIPAQVFAHARETRSIVKPFKRVGVLQDHIEPLFSRDRRFGDRIPGTRPHGLPDRFFAVKDPRVSQGRPADEYAVHPAGLDAGNGFVQRADVAVAQHEDALLANLNRGLGNRFPIRVAPIHLFQGSTMDGHDVRPALDETRAPFVDNDGVVPQAGFY